MKKEKPTYYTTAQEFRAWLDKNHQSEKELWVGFYKKATDIPSITWSESVDQALCYGWIDGIRKKVDEKSYKIRFTPRKPNSIWSAVNLAKMKELEAKGLLQAAGIAIFEKRDEKKAKLYSYEQRKKATLPPEYLEQIKSNGKAWDFFENLAPSYKKNSVFWVVNAKREETRLRRLKILIESSEQGLKIPPFRRAKK